MDNVFLDLSCDGSCMPILCSCNTNSNNIKKFSVLIHAILTLNFILHKRNNYIDKNAVTVINYSNLVCNRTACYMKLILIIFFSSVTMPPTKSPAFLPRFIAAIVLPVL